MGRIFDQQNENQQPSNNFQGGRLSRTGVLQSQEQSSPEGVFGKFINFVRDVGKGFARDVASFGLSAVELGRPSNVFRNPLKNSPKPKNYNLNIFGENVKSIQSRMDEVTNKYSRGDINKKQLAGESLSNALTALSVGLPWEIVGKNVAKGIAKKSLEEISKDIAKSSIKYGGGFGLVGGASEAMKQNAPWKEVRRSAIIGGKLGVAVGAGLGVAGHAVGKASSSLFKGLSKDIEEKSGRVERLRKKQEKSYKKIKKINKKYDIIDIVKNDKDITILKANNIKIPETGKRANGGYRYNFKTKKGEIRITPKTQESTIAHEYAHHINYKLGEGDKFTNRLTNYIEGRGKKPKIIDGYNPKELLNEIKKASLIGNRRLHKNTSEEFATAFSNALVRQNEIEKSTPLFSKFVKERILKDHKIRTKKQLSNKTEDSLVVGKKIKWTEKEDKAVEEYIKSKGISKARKSAKLLELQAHYKRLQKAWDKASFRERERINKALAATQELIAKQKFRVKKDNNLYMENYPNIKLKKDVHSKDIHGNKEKIETIAGKKLTERQIKKINEFNKRIFGDENVKITKQILTPEGQKALGVYSDGMIKILKGQADPKDTYYHEVVHKYLDIMTTMSEHKEALISAKRHFKAKTFEEAEENLAEAFIGYAKKREGLTGTLRMIFDKVINRIKKVESNKKAIGEFYDTILSRKLESKKNVKEIIPKNIPKKFIKRKTDKTKYTEKLNTGKSVEKLVKKLEKSDEVKREIQKRGIVTWKETIKEAEEMGIDITGIRKEAKTASEFASKIEAIKQVRANKAAELHDFLSQSPKNPTEKQKAEIARKIDEFLFVDRSLKSISTEHGRAINILKKEVQAQEFEMYNDLIDEIIKIDPKKSSELDYVKEIDKAINKENKEDKILNTLLNILGLSRSMMTIADMSAPLRQGIFLAARHPILFSKAFKTMLKQAFSEKYYQKSIQEFKKSKRGQTMIKAGLAITELGEDLTKREEAIMSNLPEKIPIFGKIARGSNRAYTGFINALRIYQFDNLTKTIGVVDKNISEKKLKNIAKYVNSATGRGELFKSIEKYSALLNGLFFAPGLMASRINLLNPYYYYKLDPYIRKEALKDLFAFVGTGVTVLSLAKLGGAEVGDDPRSADFGKIKIGNTRFDIWGGFQQYAVLTARLISGEMVSSTTGREFTLGEGYKPTTRGGILTKFLSYKTSPAASFAFGLLNGKSTMGDDFDVPNEIADRMIPMVISDLYDLIKENKPVGYIVPAFFGVGVQTYGDKIPYQGKTPSGRKKIVWKNKESLGGDIVNIFRGTKESEIPKNKWKPLYRKKMKEDRLKAQISNAKRRVIETGKPITINGKRIFLKNGIVKVK